MAGGVQRDRWRRPRPHLSKIALIVALLAALASVSRTFAHDDPKDHEKRDRDDREHAREREKRGKHDRAHRQSWRTIGHDAANTRNQPFEHEVSPANVHRLAPKWVATTTGDVSATPAVVNGAVYFGDFGGTLWKLDAETGAAIWSHQVPDYTGNAGDYARTSPSLAGNTLVVGVIKGSTAVPGPNMLGIDATTGALRWKTPDPPRSARGHDRIARPRRRHHHHRHLGERGERSGHGHLPRRDRRPRRADGQHSVADLLASGQRRRSRRLCRRDDVLAARGRPCGRTRLRHVRAAVHGTGERHRVPRGCTAASPSRASSRGPT